MNLQNRALCILLAALLIGMFPGVVLAEQFTLEEGTPVRLKLVNTVTSSKAHEGDEVSFKVIDDILAIDGKTVLIPAGSSAWGSVTEANKRGRIGGKGELALIIEGAQAANGKTVPLRASISREGHSKLGTVIALSLLVTPLFLFMRGKDAKIHAGAQLSAYIDRDSIIDIPSASPAVASASPVKTRRDFSPAETVPSMDEASREPEVPAYLQKYVEDTPSLSDTLQTLESLRQQGLLSEEEFETKKQALLLTK